MSGLSITTLLCPNPSPMTLEGTNTYVISSETHALIIDPGPSGYPQHLDAVVEAVDGRLPAQILLTHRHEDHSGSAVELSDRLGAPVRAFSQNFCYAPSGMPDPAPLAHAETVEYDDGSAVLVHHTPGHTSDSVCFEVPSASAMLTGDTILGRGTTMLDYPDGTLTDYLASLERLASGADLQLLPAHGPQRDSLVEVAKEYLAHRHQRLEQVRSVLAEQGNEHGELSAEQLGQILYSAEIQAGLPGTVATSIAAAQLDHLRGS